MAISNSRSFSLSNVCSSGAYSFSKVLGEGSFGTVVVAEDLAAGWLYVWYPKVAIKIVKTNEENKDSFTSDLYSVLNSSQPANTTPEQLYMREAEIMKILKHNNIVSLTRFFPFKEGAVNGLAMVMEFCPNGNLQNYLDRIAVTDQPFLRTSHRLSWYLQLSTAIKFIHSKGIAHHDLKPENILLDARNNLKVADVGLAKANWKYKHENLSFIDYMSSFKATPVYMAPEIWNGCYDMQCDVFSLGLIFLMIAEIPNPPIPYAYDGQRNKVCLGKLLKETPAYHCGVVPLTDLLGLPVKNKASDKEHKLFCDMLEYDKCRRLQIDEVFTKVDDQETRSSCIIL